MFKIRFKKVDKNKTVLVGAATGFDSDKKVWDYLSKQH